MRDAFPYPDEWTIPYALANVHKVCGRQDTGYGFLAPDLSVEKLTFSELHHEALKRGRNLLARGLTKGDKVALIVPDPRDFVLTFLGATAVGIVPVPVYPPLSFGKLDAYVEQTARVLDVARAKLLVTSKKAQHILWSLVDHVRTLTGVVLAEDLSKELAADAPVAEEVFPDDIAFLQFTSGSTSEPKGVVVTHRNLGANGHAIMYEGLDSDPATDAALAWLPLYHDMGLIGFVIAPLTAGIDVYFMPTLDFIKQPSRWMRAMSQYKATISFAPNFAYGLAARRTSADVVETLDLSRIKILGAGAEPNHPATLNAFLDHFEPAGLRRGALNPVYGMAEATLAMTFRPLLEGMLVDTVVGETIQSTGVATPITDEAEAGVEFVGCGRSFRDHEILIMDDDGTALPDRQVGEIVFRGPSVTAGYYCDPKKTTEAYRREGLRTGDLGYLANGELYVTGRKKDLIILNGKNYDPQSVEWPCAEIPGVRKGNVVAFSRPGQHTEELVVVAEVKKDADRDAIRSAIEETTRETLYLSAQDVVLLDAGLLPKTTSGKLQRAKTRLQYLDGSLGAEGIRTLGDRGQTVTLARHVAKSAISRVKSKLTRKKPV